MYNNYYGFSHKPFELNPDPDVIFLSETHQEAISILRYGVLNRKGFLQVTGNIGTGKSTLLQSLINSLGKSVRLCYMPNPNFTVQEFYYFLSIKFGFEEYEGNKAKFIINLGRFLQKCKDKTEHVLLIIDEAQVLSHELLEEIRLISNQDVHDVFGVLSIFLVGQPEFKNLLNHPRLLPLRNRIGVSFHIDPLTLEETTAYIQFRLRKAGRTTPLFTKNAYREIHQATGGIPRTINILCDNALLEGFVKQCGIIDEYIISGCAAEIRNNDYKLSASANKPQETERSGKDVTQKHVQVGIKKRQLGWQPIRIALTVTAIFALLVVVSATSDYWGKFAATAPAKDWIDGLNIDEKILVPVKKVLLGVKYRIGRFSVDIPPRPDNAILHKINGAKKVSAENLAKTMVTAISVDQGNEPGNVRGEKTSSDSSSGINFSAGDVITDIQAEETVAGQFYYVSITDQEEWVNIRSGPSMNYDILRTVSSGFPLHVLDQEEKWSLVEDFANRKGWVATRLLIENDSVILKTGKLNLRSGPGYDEGIIREIVYGTVMQIKKTSGDWLKVVDKTGAEGWILRFHVWPDQMNLR